MCRLRIFHYRTIIIFFLSKLLLKDHEPSTNIEGISRPTTRVTDVAGSPCILKWKWAGHIRRIINGRAESWTQTSQTRE